MRRAWILGLVVLLAACGGDDGGSEPQRGDDGGSEPQRGDDGGSEPQTDGATIGDLETIEDPFAWTEAKIKEAGLKVCRTDDGSGNISGSYDSVSFSVDDKGCGDPLDNAGYVSVDLYNDPTTAAEEAATPTTDAYVTWLVDPTTLVTTIETSTPEVLDILDEAFAGYPTGPGG